MLNNLSQSLAKLSVSLEKASAVFSSASTAPQWHSLSNIQHIAESKTDILLILSRASHQVVNNLRKVSSIRCFLCSVGCKVFCSNSPTDSVERITSWCQCFLWTFSPRVAQLSKYNCHMLILFGSVWHSGEHSPVTGFVAKLIMQAKVAGSRIFL